MRYQFAAVPLLVVILVITGSITSSASQYKMIKLSKYGSSHDWASAINDKGEVVGYHAGSPFLWKNGSGMQDIQMFGDDNYANGINNDGQVVGMSWLAADQSRHPCLWQSGSSPLDLGTLGGIDGWATGINDDGQVVGYSCLAGMSSPRAFLWQRESGMQNLGTLGDSNSTSTSTAYAINNSGQVVGTSDGRAFLWQTGSGMQDLGVSGTATAINNGGQVVGSSSSRAFIWETGEVEDLGTLAGFSFSYATGVNDGGQVVGYSYTSDGSEHAFLWQKGSAMQDLGTLGGISWASGINSDGWIVGGSYDATGVEYAVLWQPVPEPSSLFALLTGVCGLGGMMLRRRR